MRTERLTLADVAALALRRVDDPAGVRALLLTLDRPSAMPAFDDALALLGGLVVALEDQQTRVGAMLDAIPPDASDDVYAAALGPVFDELWNRRVDAREVLQAAIRGDVPDAGANRARDVP